MKDARNHLAWMIKAATELNLTELRVFIVWFDDASQFSAGASLLHQRLPHIARQNIQKAIRSLVKKGFLVPVSKRGSRTHYNLGQLSESEEIQVADTEESTEIQNESPQISNESSGIQKSIPTDSRTKKTKKNKEDEEARSPQVFSSESKEEDFEPLAFDHSKDPDYKSEKPWLKTMAWLKSDYQIWFDQYPITGDGYKKFEDDAREFISSNMLIKFTDDELSYDEWPEHSFIISQVETKLAERFKKNDRNPLWNFSGPICQDLVNKIKAWLDRKAVTRIPKKIESPYRTSSDEWVEDTEFMEMLKSVKNDSLS